MNDKNQFEEKNWGVHINHKKDAGYPPPPEWVNVGNRMAWTNRGVVVWEKSANTVMCLFPQQALDVLDDLKEWVKLENEPFCLNWIPTHYLYQKKIEQHGERPRTVATNHLATTQHHGVLRFRHSKLRNFYNSWKNTRRKFVKWVMNMQEMQEKHWGVYTLCSYVWEEVRRRKKKNPLEKGDFP